LKPSHVHVPSQLPLNEVLRRPLESAQYASIRYAERLADAGALASIGTVGDSFDDALAESVIGLAATGRTHPTLNPGRFTAASRRSSSTERRNAANSAKRTYLRPAQVSSDGFDERIVLNRRTRQS